MCVYIVRYGRYLITKQIGQYVELGWFVMVQDTPTGCGNDFATLFENQELEDFPAVLV